MDEAENFLVAAEVLMTYCDCCGTGTKALMYVLLPDGGVLKMCAHHATRHRPRLNDRGAFIYSLTSED